MIFCVLKLVSKSDSHTYEHWIGKIDRWESANSRKIRKKGRWPMLPLPASEISGDCMRTIATIGLLLALTTAAQAETLYYGSRAGMEVTVVKKSNIGSTHAKILTKHTKENAIAFCREYVLKVTPKCIADEMKVQLLPEISANCQTGKFTTLYGQGYQFRGPNPDYDPTSMSTEYLLVEVGSDEPLDGSSASGYDVALGQFKALCPSRVRE